ncbi:MAG: NAD-dependent DNA ligase LigA [Promethearchaeota archaeon]
MTQKKGHQVEKLAQEILRHQRLYYNHQPEISDAQFDLLMDELTTLDPSHPVLNLVGEDNSQAFAKVKHVMPMNSQAKASQITEFLKWTKKWAYKEYIVQLKLDGISVELQYLSGKFIRAVSRGDGKVGDDITQNVRKMSHVPFEVDAQFSGAVRGEIVMFHSIFDKKYSDQKNCRNMASGIAKRKDGKGCDDLAIITYNVLNLAKPFENENQKLEWMEKNQFYVVPMKIFQTSHEIIDYREMIIESLRASLDYDIDGLVIKNQEIDWEDMHRARPMKQIAFKFPPEGGITTLIGVEWSQKGGTYTPVAIVDPVELAGTTVQRASLANPDLIQSLNLKIGSKVSIVKRGEIIPKIIKVIDNPPSCTEITYPSKCETCSTGLINEGTRLFCPNPRCSKKDFHRLRKWINVLDIKNFGPVMLQQLFDSGKIQKIADLYTLSVSDITSMDRQGVKSAEKALTNLFAKNTLSLAKFIGGFDIEGIGETIADLVVGQGFDTLEKIRDAPLADLESIEQMGDINSTALQVGIDGLYNDMRAVLATGKITIQESVKGGALTWMSFCFTGKLNEITRNEAKEMVLAQGGLFKSGVGKTLDYLVTNTPDSSSSKNQKAKTFGTKIITEKDFLALF